MSSQDKRQALARLKVQQQKLAELVGELLQCADQLDELARDQSVSTSRWNVAFGKTCQEVVALSEVVNAITDLIDKGDSEGAEAALNRSIDVAKHLHERLQMSKSELK